MGRLHMVSLCGQLILMVFLIETTSGMTSTESPYDEGGQDNITSGTSSTPSITTTARPILAITDGYRKDEASCKALEINSANSYHYLLVVSRKLQLLRVCYCKGYCTYIRRYKPVMQVPLSRFLASKSDSIWWVPFVALFIIIIVGTTGNLTVIAAVLRILKDTTVVNRFVLSLAVSDLLVCTIVTPIKIVQYLRRYHLLTLVMCKFTLYLRDVLIGVSICTLTVISFERYYAICHPMNARFKCTNRRANILIISSWIVAFILGIPALLINTQIEDNGGQTRCVAFNKNFEMIKAYHMYLMLAMYILPALVMFYTYGAIMYTMWRTATQSQALSGQTARATQGNQNRSISVATETKVNGEGKRGTGSTPKQGRLRVIVTMVTLLVLYLLCWGPWLCMTTRYMWAMPDNKNFRWETKETGLSVLAYANSCMNPILFMFMSQSIRSVISVKIQKLCCVYKLEKKWRASKRSQHPINESSVLPSRAIDSGVTSERTMDMSTTALPPKTPIQPASNGHGHLNDSALHV